MSSINKQNYEAWFLDYFEGNLSPEQSERLFQFLKENPQYEDEFNSFEAIALEPSDLEFDAKSLLKHEIPAELKHELSGTDYIAISYTENILSQAEKNKVEQNMLQHKTLQRAVHAYAEIKLKPDFSLVYDDKKYLKKPVIIPFNRYREAFKYVASAAAVFFISLSIWNYNDSPINTASSGLAFTKKRKDVSGRLNKATVAINNSTESNNSSKKNVAVTKKENNNVQTLIENNKQVVEQYVEPIKIETEIENKPLLAEQLNSESQIKSETAIEAPVLKNETILAESFQTPQSLIVSKLLKSQNQELIADNSYRKSKFWYILDVASKRYSEVTGRKVKIKKVERDDNSTVFALISDKFEISHSSSKK
ncbi:MAG: hypothetical protein ACK4IK_00515 [Bacteroidia bacterium]